jgi:hypothetical protein
MAEGVCIMPPNFVLDLALLHLVLNTTLLGIFQCAQKLQSGSSEP